VEDDRWASILRTPGPSEGNWETMPEIGLGALIAYTAGPGRARPHNVPLNTRHVAVEVTRDGQTKRWTEPMTSDDLAVIESTVAETLLDLGIPAPPSAWWEVDLPGTLTADQLTERLHELTGELLGDDTGVARARREAQVVIDYVRGLYDDAQ